jgi:hypothetical protein
LTAEGKILTHFETECVSVYRLQGGVLTLLKREPAAFEEGLAAGMPPAGIVQFCDGLKEFTEVVDNRATRLYATGIFQQLSQPDAIRLVNNVYVDTGLYFNIVEPELQRFYLKRATSASGSNDMMQGVIRQEFRNVVTCGSFQQSLGYIEDVIARLRKNGVAVLSPRTTRIKPGTETTDFVLFDYQDCLKNERDTWRHKYVHLDDCRRSDAVIVCNPGGRVGFGTMFELGFVSAISKRVIFTEEPVGLSIFFPFEVGLETGDLSA